MVALCVATVHTSSAKTHTSSFPSLSEPIAPPLIMALFAGLGGHPSFSPTICSAMYTSSCLARFYYWAISPTFLCIFLFLRQSHLLAQVDIQLATFQPQPQYTFRERQGLPRSTLLTIQKSKNTSFTMKGLYPSLINNIYLYLYFFKFSHIILFLTWKINLTQFIWQFILLITVHTCLQQRPKCIISTYYFNL